jgi:hypothetical protein
MSISSHLGIAILVIVGVATILGVIIIAAMETRRMDKKESAVSQQPAETNPDKKKS